MLHEKDERISIDSLEKTTEDPELQMDEDCYLFRENL